MNDDYSNYPKSLNEHRWENSKEGQQSWGIRTPRDVLIDTLRDIDSGKINATMICIVLDKVDDEGVYYTCTNSSAKNFFELIGMLTRAVHILNK